MMSEKEARVFITQVAPLGTMDYSLLHQRPSMIKTNYRFSWPVPPVTLVKGIVVVVLLISGIVLGCYVYWMGKTFKLVTGTVKRVTKKPLSSCCLLFSRVFKCAPGLVHLHLPYDNKRLSRMFRRHTRQRSTQYK